MPDLVVAGIGAFIAERLGGKELLIKLLGPTADYLGGEVRSHAEKGVQNLTRIFSKSLAKLAGNLDEPGEVPSRVLKDILREGYFCEDELTAEYFAGVLASSRAKVARDDRAATTVKLLSGLSSYQVRTHYIFYAHLRRTYLGLNLNVLKSPVRRKLATYFPLSSYRQAMEFGPDEDQYSILSHTLTGLRVSGLVGGFVRGSESIMLKRYPARRYYEDYGFVLIPTLFGMLLFLSAHGDRDLTQLSFFDNKLQLPDLAGITVPETIHPIWDPGDQWADKDFIDLSTYEVFNENDEEMPSD